MKTTKRKTYLIDFLEQSFESQNQYCIFKQKDRFLSLEVTIIKEIVRAVAIEELPESSERILVAILPDV